MLDTAKTLSDPKSQTRLLLDVPIDYNEDFRDLHCVCVISETGNGNGNGKAYQRVQFACANMSCPTDAASKTVRHSGSVATCFIKLFA